MNIEGVNGDGGVATDIPVEVDVGNNIARIATICITKDPLKITSNGYGRLRHTLESRGRSVLPQPLAADSGGHCSVVMLGDSLEEGRDNGHNSRDCEGICSSQLCHWEC